MRGSVVIACLIIVLIFLYVRNESQDTSLEQARANTSSKSMTFNECQRQIQAVSRQLVVEPVPIVKTTDLIMVRFTTLADPKYRGVLIACSRPDRKMVIAKLRRGEQWPSTWAQAQRLR